MAREFSKLYKELAELPIYTSAFFLNSSKTLSTIRVTTSVRDHLRNTKRALTKHIVSIPTPKETVVTPVQDVGDALASFPSPSGKKLGILREVQDGGAKKRFVEVWFGNRLEASKEVTKTHEAFHLNPLFFSLSFSRSETSLVYCAEAKAPEAKDTPEELQEKFKFVPDFGERLQGKKRPNLYLFKWSPRDYNGDTEGETKEDHPAPSIFSLKPSLPEDSTFVFGQASFTPDEEHIFATGYPQTLDGRRLGPLGCWNHPSSIFKLQLPKDFSADSEEITVEATQITPMNVSARSPRVSNAAPDGTYTTVWLENVGPAHASCTSLVSLRSNENNPKVLVDCIQEPSNTEAFPGLYLDQLPSQPFLALHSSSPSAASHIITHSIWRSYQKVLIISLNNDEVRNVTSGDEYSWFVAGTDGRDGVLAVRSAINLPHELLEGRVEGNEVKWNMLDKPVLSDLVKKKLHSIEFTVQPVPDRYPVELITYQISGAKNLPTITIPHGGPHVAFTTEFNAPNLAYALEGYVINLVNYTGSLGFGQKHANALIGSAGNLDIKDCYESIKYLAKLGITREGPGKQFVLGGSHGGFISAHLIGQYPDFFSAASIRNPVIAAGEIASVSDIPDWAYLEFGKDFGPKSEKLCNGTFDKLQAASPIAYIEQVKTPVLLLIGEVDRRVPPSQGRNYYYELKGRGQDVKMLVFPEDGHPLDSVEAELVSWESTREWFGKFEKR